MSYSDARPLRDRVAAAAPTLLVQAAVGYALLSGLAITTFAKPERKLTATSVTLQPPPPPDPIVAPPPPTARAATNSLPHVPITIVPTASDNPVAGSTDLVIVDLPSMPTTVTVEPPPLPGRPVDLGRGAAPVGNQGDWFPRDAYPAAARRAGAQGLVSVSVEVGEKGRVTACRVTASSGSDELDAATCRLASRNGRFRPALDAGGQRVAATYALRNVRWVLEE
jgi:protein TonB